MKLSLAHISSPHPTQTVNGDRVVVRKQGDLWLLAVIDALGHGVAAAQTASIAEAELNAVELPCDIRQTMGRLDKALRGSRGAAAMVCMIQEFRLTGCGVGNVEMRVDGASVPVVLSPGILGAGVRKLHVFEGLLRTRSRLIIFSDGLSCRLSIGETRARNPEDTCATVFQKYRRNHDDATVMVVDVEAGEATR